MALPNDTNIETLIEVLCHRLISRIAKMRHKANNGTNAAQPRYIRHHEARVRKATSFRVGQLEFVD